MPYIGKSPGKLGVRQRYHYTATGGETSKSGTDDNGLTLKFEDGEYVDVYINGILLVAGSDYNTATANTISSLSALAANDILEVIVYDIYSLAKVNSEAQRTKYYVTATGGETSISGTDDDGSTITFTAGAQIDVRLNGVSLKQGDDYNTTVANTVGGLTALTAGQLVEIVVYEKFVLADALKKSGDTMTGGLSAPSITSTGDLTVDTSTLYVDSANNRVGVGTTSTVAQSKMTVAGNSLSITGYDNGFTSGGNRAMIDFGANYMRLGGLTGGGSTVNGIKFITPAGGDAAILDSDGLKFNGDTAAANALDDYEEGTWTPTISNGTISVSYASYTKIGNTVHLRATLSTFSDRSTASAITIGGLPYASASNSKTSQGILGRYVNSGGDAIVAYIGESSSVLYFFTTNQSDAYYQVQHNHLSSNSSNLFITISYIA